MHHPEERDQRLGGQGEQDGSRAASCKQKAEVWVRAESGRTRGREQREIGKRGEGAGREEMAPDHCHSHPHSRWPYLTRGSTHHLWQQGLMAGSRAWSSHIQDTELACWSPSLPLCGIHFKKLDGACALAVESWKRENLFMCVFQKHLLFRTTSHQRETQRQNRPPRIRPSPCSRSQKHCPPPGPLTQIPRSLERT